MKSNKVIHVVSFNNPFPPVYGGVIDVYFKLKALHEIGYQIHLYSFVRNLPKQQSELEKICASVHFYERKWHLKNLLSLQPFSIISRFHKDLFLKLKNSEEIVLFESFQTTSMIGKLNLKNAFLRLHNDEENYYGGIARSEKNPLKKLVFKIESLRYKRYQPKMLRKFRKVFTLSLAETEWVEKLSGNAEYVPVFHGNREVDIVTGRGNYALFHGDLRTSDNLAVAKYFIEIFKKNDSKLIIASSTGRGVMEKEMEGHENLTFVQIESFDHLKLLIQNAQFNLVYSFQNSGTKLKLLNSLFYGRFCLINENVVDDEALKDLCISIKDEAHFIQQFEEKKEEVFSGVAQRKKVLEQQFSDLENARKIDHSLTEFL